MACEDGVVVVVDFTDLGGGVESGCAPGAPANGRDALAAAGFASTDGTAGFICAIDAKPDPCPESFDGSFWAYWHATPGGEWLTYNEGADTSQPEPGSIEGWRYNDGATPPGIATADVVAAGGDPQIPAAADDARTTKFIGLPVSDLIVLASVIVVMVVAAIVVQRRRRPARSGE